MRPTRRVARRIPGTALGLVALASFLLPGPTSAPAAASPQERSTPALAVGGELPVADQGPPAPRYTSSRPDSAYGDGVHLVVWADDGDAIRASRLSEAGEVLDPVSLRLAPGQVGFDPVASFDGTNFLVVWQADGFIAARRVSPDGTLLDASPFVVSNRTTQNEPTAIAFDGTNHFVVWTSPDASGLRGDIFGRHVSPGGTVIEPADLSISTDPADQRRVDLAFNGTQHLLVWEHGSYDATDLHGTLVDPAGVPANPSGAPISNAANAQTAPAVTAVGSDFFVAWSDARGASEDIYGTRVSATGGVADPAGSPIADGTGHQAFPAVATDGSQVLVTWLHDFIGPAEQTRFSLVDDTGAVADPDGRVLPITSFEVGISFDGATYLVAGRNGARVDAGGTVLDPEGLVLSTVGNGQTGSDSAFDGTDTLVVWRDDRIDGGRIFGGRLGPNGERRDGAGFPISSGVADATFREHANPAVAFDGTTHLVVWSEWHASGPSIQAATISRSGEVLDTLTVATGSADVSVQRPAVAFGGGTFLVAWQSSPSDPRASEIRAARVSPGGALLDPAAVALNTPGVEGIVDEPAIAFGGSQFLVAWQENRGFGTAPDIYGARVTTAGSVADPGGTPVSTAPRSQRNPDVAWHDGRFLVVWDDERAGDTSNFMDTADIYGARLDGNGEVLDPDGFPLAGGPVDQRSPSVAANGRFFVAWTDRRQPDAGIYGTHVEASGTVRDPGGRAISTSRSSSSASVSPGSGGDTYTVTYERFLPESPYSASRAFARHVAPK